MMKPCLALYPHHTMIDAPDSSELLTVRKAAQQLGVTPRTLKYYEERGLVTPTRSDGRYRLYDQADMVRFSRILRLRAAGFSLHSIAEIVSRPSELTSGNGRKLLSDAALGNIESALRGRLSMVDERLHSLQHERQELEGIRKEVQADLDYIQARLAGEDVETLLAARRANLPASRGKGRPVAQRDKAPLHAAAPGSKQGA